MEATSATTYHPIAPELPVIDDKLGRILSGTYRIERLIARGGMGAVYEAEHLRLHRRVAIKVLLDVHAKDPQVLESFRREAVIISQLRHPHIVQILDVDEMDEGQPFFVMEHLDGDTAGARLRERGRFSISDAVRVVSAASSALTHVHAAGIVHCDLKPTNIFLVRVTGQPDFVKMLDFGVSVEAALSAGHRRSEVAGTPNYMAPEQAYGRLDLDHRVDQFALAAITYELLTGRKAFSGADTDEVLDAVVSGTPRSVSALVPGTPSAFDRVLARALSKDPGGRYANIAAFARALETAALDSGVDTVVRTRSDAPSFRYSVAPNAAEDLRPASRTSEPPTAVQGRPTPAKGTASPVEDRAATPETLLRMARLHWTADHLDEAVACAEQLLDLAVHDKRTSLRRMIGSAIPFLDAIFEARTGGADALLAPGPRLRELRDTLSGHAAALVAHVAGPTTVADVLQVTEMPRRDGMRMIAGLLRRGVLVRG